MHLPAKHTNKHTAGAASGEPSSLRGLKKSIKAKVEQKARATLQEAHADAQAVSGERVHV